MQCVIHQILAEVNERGKSQIEVLPTTDHVPYHLSVSAQGTTVLLTCSCGATCSLGFKRPEVAARWALQLKMARFVSGCGVTAAASWLRLSLTSGQFMMTNTLQVGAANWTQIGMMVGSDFTIHNIRLEDSEERREKLGL